MRKTNFRKEICIFRQGSIVVSRHGFVPGVRSYNLFSVLKRSPFLIILYNPFLAFREWERVSQKARHETSRDLQVEVSAAGFHISTPSHSASSLHRVRLCCVLSRMQMQQKMQPRLVLRQAVVRQPVVPSHARPAQPWLGQVHQLGQLNPARPMAMPVAMPTPIVKAVVKPVVKPLQWVYAAPLQSTPGRSINPKVVLCGRCKILVDLRGQDRASGAIPAVPGIAPLARSCPNPSHGSPQENREICGGVWGPAGCGIVFASIQLTEPSPMR